MRATNVINARSRIYVAARHGRPAADRYLILRAQGVSATVALRTATSSISRCTSAQFHAACERQGAQICFNRFGEVVVKLGSRVIALMASYGAEPRHYLDAAA